MGGRPRVLVVDDDVDHVTMLEVLLGHVGFDVVVAHSFREARALLLDASTFNALVADLWLGDGSALDLLEGLGAAKPRVAVVLSGFDRPEDIERTRAAGFDAHLVKPTSLDRLVAVLRVARGEEAPSGVHLVKTKPPPVVAKRSAS